MNARAVAYIACRLLAVFILVAYVLNFAVQGVLSLALMDGASGRIGFVTLLAAGLFYGLIVLLLWFGTSAIAKRFGVKMPESFSEDMAYENWQALAFTALGGLALLKAADVMREIFKVYSTYGLESYHLGEVLPSLWSGVAVFAGLGVVLVLLPRTLCRGLNALRAFGNKPLIEAEDQ